MKPVFAIVALAIQAQHVEAQGLDPAKPFLALPQPDYRRFITVFPKSRATTARPDCKSGRCLLEAPEKPTGHKIYAAVAYDNGVDETHCSTNDDHSHEFKMYLDPPAEEQVKTRLPYDGINLIVQDGKIDGLYTFIIEWVHLKNPVITLSYADYLDLKKQVPDDTEDITISLIEKVQDLLVKAPVDTSTMEPLNDEEKAKITWIVETDEQAHALFEMDIAPEQITFVDYQRFKTNPFIGTSDVCPAPEIPASE